MEPRLQVAARYNWHLLWMLMMTVAIAGCKSSQETTGGGKESEKRIPTATILQIVDDPELELPLEHRIDTATNYTEYSGESSAFVPGNIWVMSDSGWVKSIELYTKYPDGSRKGSISMKAITGVANAVDPAIMPWIKAQIQQHQAMEKVPVKQYNGEIEDEVPTVKTSKEFAEAKVTLTLWDKLTLLIEF